MLVITVQKIQAKVVCFYFKLGTPAVSSFYDQTKHH